VLHEILQAQQAPAALTEVGGNGTSGKLLANAKEKLPDIGARAV
jgi:hypothetical protein